jgi:hypothetical protein
LGGDEKLDFFGQGVHFETSLRLSEGSVGFLVGEVVSEGMPDVGSALDDGRAKFFVCTNNEKC